MSTQPSSQQGTNDKRPDWSSDLVLEPYEETVYQRPNQPWICGHTCNVCAQGPTSAGECRTTAECLPSRNQGAWICNRSKLQGGKCEDGPSDEGKCCRPITACVPVKNLRQQRGRFVSWCVVGMLGAGLLTLGSSWRNEILVPGGLTEQHAQLLNGKNTDRCAECHGAASAGLGRWTLATLLPSQAIGKPQSELCLECHKETLSQESAMLAHGMTAESLTEMIEATAVRLGANGHDAHEATKQTACSACHREHHGATANLSQVTNQQCVSCHQDQFTEFAAGHPPFDHWPYRRRPRIAFDHAAHQAKHFPEAKVEGFDCRMCHEPGGATGIVATSIFEKACANCHEKKIDDSLAQGVNVLSLPLLDIQALAAAGYDVGHWPKRATGSFDGSIAPMTRLLLGSDRRAAAALAQFDASFDFLDIDPESIDDLEAAHDIAWGIKQLIYDLAQDTRALFKSRLEAALRTLLTDEQAEALSAQLSPALVSGMQQKWFPHLMEEVPAYRSQQGLPVDGLEGGPIEPSRIVLGNMPVLSQLGSAGGTWSIDHEVYSLSVIPKRHASAFVHSWIELLGRNARQVLPETSWPLRDLLVSATSPGQCITCHSIENLPGRPFEFDVNWHANRGLSTDGGATKFSHDPHLLQPGYEDCQSCHQLASGKNVMASYADHDPTQFECGFEPMLKQDCAQCHHQEGAGDSCLKCHNYHESFVK